MSNKCKLIKDVHSLSREKSIEYTQRNGPRILVMTKIFDESFVCSRLKPINKLVLEMFVVSAAVHSHCSECLSFPATCRISTENRHHTLLMLICRSQSKNKTPITISINYI